VTKRGGGRQGGKNENRKKGVEPLSVVAIGKRESARGEPGVENPHNQNPKGEPDGPSVGNTLELKRDKRGTGWRGGPKREKQLKGKSKKPTFLKLNHETPWRAKKEKKSVPKWGRNKNTDYPNGSSQKQVFREKHLCKAKR